MPDKVKGVSKYYMPKLPPLWGSKQPLRACVRGNVHFLRDTSREGLHQLQFSGSTHDRAQSLTQNRQWMNKWRAMSQYYHYACECEQYHYEKKRHCESMSLACGCPAGKWLNGAQIWVHLILKPFFLSSMLHCLLQWYKSTALEFSSEIKKPTQKMTLVNPLTFFHQIGFDDVATSKVK